MDKSNHIFPSEKGDPEMRLWHSMGFFASSQSYIHAKPAKEASPLSGNYRSHCPYTIKVNGASAILWKQDILNLTKSFHL